ncbi:MAG: GNAT family N-acetyltransferase [Lachnospiraceae bacterium]|nr:GNAT family N-acetyltransferase [Robinsoniella sp.]MDY3767346.1 GNAT family N-acetyltransferase [Lachnospiraceae bacterium]
METKSISIKGKNNQEFLIRRAKESDVEGIMTVMDTAKALAPEGWFISDDRGYVEAHVQQSGFIIVAEENGTIAGFFMIDFAGETERNMGQYLGLNQEEQKQVVYMDSAAVLPKYRGNHLQAILLQAAEEVLDEMPQYRYRMATVCPDNCYSLQNMQRGGYTILTTVKKYGNFLRHIMYKDTEQKDNRIAQRQEV